MPYIQNIFNKTKTNLDIWFFYAFLLSFSFSVRKILFYFPIQGTFNEYTAIFVYISDIFLFLTIFSWLIIILCNNTSILSMCRLWITPYLHKLYNKLAIELKFLFHNDVNKQLAKSKNENVSRLPRKMFHVEHFLRNGIFVIIPFILIALSFISISWSQNQPVALFRSIKLFEYYLLYIYIIFRIVPHLPDGMFHPVKAIDVPRGTSIANGAGVEKSLRGGTAENSSRWNSIFSIIIFVSLFQSIIGILQFITQRSIGLFWLGESHISQIMPGVAKIIFNGHTLIRSYGLFPHPNIFAGFLLLSLLLCMIYKNTNHRPLLLSGRIRFKGFNIVIGRKNLDFIIFIQSVAILLTFSKSAIIGLAIALFYIYVPRFHSKSQMFHACPVDSDCSMWNNQNFYGVEHLSSLRGEAYFKILTANRNFRVIILLLLIVVFWLHLAGPNFDSNLYKSLNERILYLNVSPAQIATQSVAGGRGTIKDFKTLLFGIGEGQFVWNMQKYKDLLSWQFQPVHNVFLLIWSELGIVGLGLFIYWLYLMFQPAKYSNVPRLPRGTKMFHMEHFSSLRGGTNIGKGINLNKTISNNNYYYLSSVRLLRYFKAILIGFIFIMLFDHYFWDIQQGSIMLWMILGFIAGIKKNC